MKYTRVDLIRLLLGVPLAIRKYATFNNRYLSGATIVVHIIQLICLLDFQIFHDTR